MNLKYQFTMIGSRCSSSFCLIRPGHIVLKAAAISRNAAIVSLSIYVPFTKRLATLDRAVSVFLSVRNPCCNVCTGFCLTCSSMCHAHSVQDPLVGSL